MSDNKSQILIFCFMFPREPDNSKAMDGCGGNQSQGNLFSVGHAGPGLGKEKYASPSDISRPHHPPGYGGSPMLVVTVLLLELGWGMSKSKSPIFMSGLFLYRQRDTRGDMDFNYIRAHSLTLARDNRILICGISLELLRELFPMR